MQSKAVIETFSNTQIGTLPPRRLTKRIINGCTSARYTNPGLHQGLQDTTMSIEIDQICG